MRTINIGLVGLGRVGGEVARLIEANRQDFMRRLDADVRVSWACDLSPEKRLKRLGLKRNFHLTKDFHRILADPSVDIVIELIGGLGAAKKVVFSALKSGHHVITANKHLLSHYWRDIFELAHLNQRRVLFEASVAGAIPIVQSIKESLSANRIVSIIGILNGTTNYILSRMARESVDLKSALSQAQALGLAERDPTLDLDGTDAVDKLSILASLVTGCWVPAGQIYREGIGNVHLDDVLFAVSELRRTVKLIGFLRWGGKIASGKSEIEARVYPALIPLDHPLAAVHGDYNAVLVDSNPAGDLIFYGKGAGPGPAASAVVGDLFMLSQEILGSRKPVSQFALWSKGPPVSVRPTGEAVSEFYLRFLAADRPGVLARITGVLGRNGVSIAQIFQKFGGKKTSGKVLAEWSGHTDRPRAELVPGIGPAQHACSPGGARRATRRVPIVIVTHPARESQLLRAVTAIRNMPFVSPKATCLRLL